MSNIKRFKINSENGRLIICDSNLKYLEFIDIHKDASDRNYLCLVSGEDEFTYDIGIVNEFNNLKIENRYKRKNGYFGINVDSGKLMLLNEGEWKNDKKEKKVFLDSGNYRASVFTYEFGEYSEYRDDLVKKIGEKNMKYSEYVDKVGLFAWGITIMSIISLFTDIGQEYWFIPFLCWFLSWYLYFRLVNTKRYEKIERIRMRCENIFPQYIIKLEKDNANIPGGVQILDY